MKKPIFIFLCLAIFAGTTAYPADKNDAADKYIFGTLQNTSGHLASNYNAGMRMAILSLGWDNFYTTAEGTKNTTYINSQQSLLQSYRAMGYRVMLDFGIQYPPAWIYDYENSRLKNQYGEEFSGGIGETAVNAVFNNRMRQKQEDYIKDVFQTFGNDFEIVRLGFMRYGELGYIQPDYHSNTNCYWAFDAIAQGNTGGVGLPDGIPICPVPGWLPGTADNLSAGLFIEWYINALKNYHDWQITTVRKYFANEMAMLYPSWGLRDGQIAAAIAVNLNGSSPAEGTMEVQRAHDFKRFIEGITDPKLIVYGTWIDSNPEWSSPGNPCPIEFLAGLARPLNLKVMGENTGGGGLTEMALTFRRMEENELAGIMWAFESDLYDNNVPVLSNYAQYIATYLGIEPPAKRIPIVKPLWTTEKDTESDWGGLNAPLDDKYIMTPIEGFGDSYQCTLSLTKYFKNNKWDAKWGNQPAPDTETQNEGWSNLHQFAVVYQDEYGSDRMDNNPYALERNGFTIESDDATVTIYAVVQPDGNIRSFCDAQPLDIILYENLTSPLTLPPAIGQNRTTNAGNIMTNGTNKKIELATSKNFLSPTGAGGNSKYAVYSRGRHAFSADFLLLTYSVNKVPDLLQNPRIKFGSEDMMDAPETIINLGAYSTDKPLLLKGSIESASIAGSPFSVESGEAVLSYEIIAEAEAGGTETRISLTATSAGNQVLATWTNEAVNLSEGLPNGSYTLKFRYETEYLSDVLKTDTYRVIFSVNNPITEMENATFENDPVIATRYYTMQGAEIKQPSENGMYIVRKIHASQKECTSSHLLLVKKPVF
jgi:hypothetical protein